MPLVVWGLNLSVRSGLKYHKRHSGLPTNELVPYMMDGCDYIFTELFWLNEGQILAMTGEEVADFYEYGVTSRADLVQVSLALHAALVRINTYFAV